MGKDEVALSPGSDQITLPIKHQDGIRFQPSLYNIELLVASNCDAGYCIQRPTWDGGVQRKLRFRQSQRWRTADPRRKGCVRSTQCLRTRGRNTYSSDDEQKSKVPHARSQAFHYPIVVRLAMRHRIRSIYPAWLKHPKRSSQPQEDRLRSTVGAQ